MPQTVFFAGVSHRLDAEDPETVILVFHARHERGGESLVKLEIPRRLAMESWAIERARSRANMACAAEGAGQGESIAISLGW